MKSPTVHIVTLNWNGLEDTLECLESISKLTYPAVTTVVVDNGSRNQEAETIENRFPEAVLLKQSENLGFCGGCNAGIRYAMNNGADYVMLLNNDTLVPPDLLEKLFAGLNGLEKVGAVSPIILEYPETEKIWFSRARWEPERALFSLADGNEGYEDIAETTPYNSEFASGCCLLTPIQTFKTGGLLDERYFAFYDEAAWCSHIRRLGFESFVIPSAFMYHKVSKGTPALVSTYLLSRNRLLWMKENLNLAARARSFGYLAKEVTWHACNLLGLTKEHYSKQHSRALLQGYKDYFRRRFNRWNERTEAIIFPES